MKFTGYRLADKALLFYVRNVPNHPFKLRFVNTINDFFFNDAIQLKTDRDARFRLSSREQTGHDIIVQGAYEPVTVGLAKTIMQDGGVFFDVGANIGLFSIQLSMIENVVVYAVEPSAGIFSKLLKNIRLSHAENIHPINIGLSYQDGFAYMFNKHPGNLGTTKVVEKIEQDSHLIRLCTLAELLTYLKITEIKLMKIDVEGYELNVLKGLFEDRNTIYPENLILEFNELIEETGHNQRESFEYILGLGYAPFNVLEQPWQFGESLPESNLLFKYKG